jgi:hypothetical protein
MDSTRNKQDVIYLERGQAGGQYYLNLWFEEDSGASEAD